MGPRCRAFVVMALMVGCIDDTPDETDSQAYESTTALTQQSVAIPMYIHYSDTEAWERVTNLYPGVSLLVVNGEDGVGGPGVEREQVFADRINAARAAGIIVLGYTWSRYGWRPYNCATNVDPATNCASACPADNPNTMEVEGMTCCGGTDPTQRCCEGSMEDDINLWYEWYGVDGIFVDESDNGSSVNGACDSTDQAAVKAHVKGMTYGETETDPGYLWPRRIVVFNTGSPVHAQSIFDSCDILLDKEMVQSTDVSYRHPYGGTDESPQMPFYNNSLDLAHRFWHLPRNVGSTELLATRDETRQNRAGLIMIDNDASYSNLPVYLADQLDRVKPISRMSADNSDTQVFYRYVHSNVAWTKNIYIDSDNNAGTGTTASGIIGADYKIDNGGNLFSWSGGSWVDTTINATISENQIGPIIGNTMRPSYWRVEVTLARSAIGNGTQGTVDRVVFGVSRTGWAEQFTESISHVYTSVSSTAKFKRTSVANDSNRIYIRSHIGGDTAGQTVFIDTDENGSTGLQVNGIGADYKIDGENLYQYTGPGGTFEGWGDGRPEGSGRPVAAVTKTFSGTIIEWTLYRQDIGETRLNDDRMKVSIRSFPSLCCASPSNSLTVTHKFTP